MCHYLFMISLDRCYGSYTIHNTIEDPYGRIYFPKKTEDVNLNVNLILNQNLICYQEQMNQRH